MNIIQCTIYVTQSTVYSRNVHHMITYFNANPGNEFDQLLTSVRRKDKQKLVN